MRTVYRFVAVLVLVGSASAQIGPYDSILYSAIISGGSSSGVYFVDTSTDTLATAYQFADRTRGGIVGPDGLVYLGFYNLNGIIAIDPNDGTTVKSVLDNQNQIMGAPYQPAHNYDNVGGFGIHVKDSNNPPPPAPASGRNTATVDFSSTGTFQMDGWVPRSKFDQSDWWPNLFKPGTFVGVTASATDFSITEYPLATNPPQALTLTTLVTISNRCYLDSLWAEDGNLYCWGSESVGVHIVDLRAQQASVTSVVGLPTGTLQAAIWDAPWEDQGMTAYICGSLDFTIYQVDLLARPIIAVKTQTTLPVSPSDVMFTGRNAEESELTSWWTGTASPGARTFHVNFGKTHAGESAILVPSLTGLTAFPAVLSGLEIYLTVDQATLLGLQGLLPYSLVKTLDPNGEADFNWRGFGGVLGATAYWQAVTLQSGVFTNASNIINVNL